MLFLDRVLQLKEMHEEGKLLGNFRGDYENEEVLHLCSGCGLLKVINTYVPYVPDIYWHGEGRDAIHKVGGQRLENFVF